MTRSTTDARRQMIPKPAPDLVIELSNVVRMADDLIVLTPGSPKVVEVRRRLQQAVEAAVAALTGHT